MQQIGNLRYRRFVIDQRQMYQTRDGVLLDAIDALSLNLYVGQPEDISIALRMSWAQDVTDADYLHLLTSQLGAHLDAGPAIICSRLAASGSGIDVRKLVLLFRRAYEIGVRSHGHLSFLSTHGHRIPLFERFGYRNLSIVINDAIAGDQHALVLDMRDLTHMEKVLSPLVPVAQRLAREGYLSCLS